ncbi:MAG: putative metal-dependent hydrolase [Chlorobi bacterium]|nr:putative metal-dependent hydrolase [Chlorobiota bacterium]
MLTEQERAERIGRIEHLPALAEAAVRDLNDSQLDTPYRDGGWNIRQVIHHLADSHMNAIIRMKLLLTEDNPTIKPYDQDSWVALADSAAHPVDASLAILRGLHDRWGALLRSMPESAWSRPGTHPEIGAITMDDLLVNYSDHGTNHVGQITGLRERNGW